MFVFPYLFQKALVCVSEAGARVAQELPRVPREVCGRRARVVPRLALPPGPGAVRSGALPGVDVLLRAAELALANAMPMVSQGSLARAVSQERQRWDIATAFCVVLLSSVRQGHQQACQTCIAIRV